MQIVITPDGNVYGYSNGCPVDEFVSMLVSKGKTYWKDGALWFRTTEYGDDKDRVIIKGVKPCTQ